MPARPTPARPMPARPAQGSRVARRAVRKELARLPAEVLKLLAFCSFAKHFKLFRQLVERK